MNNYIVSSNVLSKDVRHESARRALEFAIYFAVKFKENFMVFQGDNKDKLIALIRGHEIKEGE